MMITWNLETNAKTANIQLNRIIDKQLCVN